MCVFLFRCLDVDVSFIENFSTRTVESGACGAGDGGDAILQPLVRVAQWGVVGDGHGVWGQNESEKGAFSVTGDRSGTTCHLSRSQ